jgi:hypothetical protein
MSMLRLGIAYATWFTRSCRLPGRKITNEAAASSASFIRANRSTSVGSWRVS